MMRFVPLSLAFGFALPLLLACSSSQDAARQASGGQQGLGGGSVAAGGASSGGRSATGGIGGALAGGSAGGDQAYGGASSGGASGAAGSPGGAGGNLTSGGSPNGGAATSGGAPSGGAGGSISGSGAGGEVQPVDFDVYWSFETSSGNTVMPAIGSENLELDGAVLQPGPTGQQLTLAGEGTSAGSARAVVDTSKDFSVAAWVKLDELDGYDSFVAIDGTQLSAAYLQKRDDDRFAFSSFASDDTAQSACVATAEISPRAGEWYLVVGTRSAATREQRIYVDGVLSGKVACPGGVFSATGGISLGRGLYAGEPVDWMQGAVDGVGLASRVLSPEEVFDLYQAGRPEAAHYLFAYFVEVSQSRGDGLRLAHSHDGLHWGAIGAGKVFMPPSVGSGSFRDPQLMRAPDGLYHLVWTTSCVSWGEPDCVPDRGFGHATSPDLVTWSAADYITVDLEVEHVWAPEAFFDPASSQYLLFWSSPPDLTPGISDPHQIYYMLTPDFETFTEPAVLYSQSDRNFIDATIRADGDGYLMILKDEASDQKNLRALRSSVLYGPGAWTSAPSAPLTGNYSAEGPSLLERDGELFLYFDKYNEGSYGALRASSNASLDDPAAWQDISSSVFFPGVRHGTAIEVPWEVYRSVALAAGE